MESSDEEEANIHLIVYHEENEITFYFFYHDLFSICKRLNKETKRRLSLLSLFCKYN